MCFFYDRENTNITDKGEDLLPIESYRQFPNEQKKGHKETGDLLNINRHIIKWIYDRKADNMVLQSWMLNCLKMYIQQTLFTFFRLLSSSLPPCLSQHFSHCTLWPS